MDVEESENKRTNESFSQMNQIDSKEKPAQTPDPYENGQKTKAGDFFLGFFLLLGEISGYSILVVIFNYISSDLLDWFMNYGETWYISIMIILDIILIVRWVKIKRKYLIVGFLVMPFCCYYIGSFLKKTE